MKRLRTLSWTPSEAYFALLQALVPVGPLSLWLK